MKKSEAYKVEDYTRANAPRVFGTETETNSDIFTTQNVVYRFGVGVGYEKPQNHLLRLVDYVPQKYRVSHGELPHTSAVISTGGIIYIDGVADHPVFESATPECLTPEEVRMHEHAGLSIMVQTMNNIARDLQLPKPKVYKRSGYADVYGPDGGILLKKSSLADHENYSTRTSMTMDIESRLYRRHFPENAKITKGLFTIAVLRKLIDGAGMVADGHYSISQKPDAFDFTGKGGDSPVHGRKMIGAYFRDRYELRSGEDNKSDWVIEHKIALTSLLLRYIDRDDFPDDLILADPAHALLDIARDPHAKVWLMDGVHRPAADVLNELTYRAREDAESYGELPEFEAEAVEIQEGVTRDLRDVSFADNHVGKVGEYLDWAGRLHQLYQQGIKHHQITSHNLRQVMKDLKWDLLDENDNDDARKYFRQFGHATRQWSVPEVPNTRAKWRTQVAGELFKKGTLDNVVWWSVKSTNPDTPEQIVDNPFTSQPSFGYIQDAFRPDDK